ncbi:hypothetical protein EDD11_004777 [Mortierella claussenii]|nr:hypothetical protein EDD11_004777 [Mortierella claussenii]
MSVVETFHGYIETTQDTLLIFEACRRGLLPRICRRLQEKERRIVQSGTVFVFDERESGIKRWTDGLVWSPSRILGNFLVYRELDKRSSGKKDTSPIDRNARSSLSDTENAIEKNKERALVGSLTNSYRFKKNGLIKKSMSIVVNGVSQHMISYYSKEDVLEGKLCTPSSVAELAGLEISPEFLVKQNFRIPPSYDHSFGHHVRPKSEPDLAGTSPLDVFSKSYSHQPHHTMHQQQNYHALAHLNGPQQGQHSSQHSYSSTSQFPTTFGYNSMSNTNSDVSSGTPPSLRYLPRDHTFMPYSGSASPHPTGTQHQQNQQQHPTTHQRHSLSSSPYSASSQAMMSSPGGANGSSSHEIGLSMGYRSPVPSDNSSSTLEGISPHMNRSQSLSQPQTQYYQQQHHQQQHYHHTPLSPSTQGWEELGYSSYPGSSSGLPSLHDHHSQRDSLQYGTHSDSP